MRALFMLKASICISLFLGLFFTDGNNEQHVK